MFAVTGQGKVFAVAGQGKVFAVAGQARHMQECYLHSNILAQVSNPFGWQCWPIPDQACVYHPIISVVAG